MNLLIVLLLLAAAASALPPATLLRLENSTDGRVFQFQVAPGELFTVTYHHSIYDAPVSEQFVVSEDRRIVLMAVASASAAVREYFGLNGAGEHHALKRAFATLDFRVAMGEPQTLAIAGQKISFSEIGAPGDRIRFSLSSSRRDCPERPHE